MPTLIAVLRQGPMQMTEPGSHGRPHQDIDPDRQPVTGSDTADLNVLGAPLETCCTDPMTGFYRTGQCRTGPEDVGLHTVCAELDARFLEFTRSRGNDLSSPRPQFGFLGLKPGDRWCLCAARWKEALVAGAAPKVVLGATHRVALTVVSLDELRAHAVDGL